MPSMIGLDRLVCQQGSDSNTIYGIIPFCDLWHFVPFCDIMAYGHFVILDILGLVPDAYYGLLAILLHTWRHFVTDGVIARGIWYPMPIYPFIQSGQFAQVTWETKLSFNKLLPTNEHKKYQIDNIINNYQNLRLHKISTKYLHIYLFQFIFILFGTTKLY